MPKYQARQFVCISDKDKYRELTAEPGNISAWFLSPKAGVDAWSKDSFELVQFTVDGMDRPIRASSKRSRIMRTPAGVAGRTVQADFDG